MAAGDVVLVLSPPGAVDAKGSFKNSIPVSSLVTTGGEMTFYGFGLTWVDASRVTIGEGTLSLADGTSQYKSTLTTPLTISMNVSGAGGLDTGTKQSFSWYHIWYIVNKTTGASSAVFSLSTTSPTLPAGYTLKRRIGSTLSANVNAGQNVTKFVQTGSGPDKLYTWGEAQSTSGSGTVVGSVTYTNMSAGASPLATSMTLLTGPANPIDPLRIVSYYARSTSSPLSTVTSTDTNPYFPITTVLIQGGELGFMSIGTGFTIDCISWTDSL